MARSSRYHSPYDADDLDWDLRIMGLVLLSLFLSLVFLLTREIIAEFAEKPEFQISNLAVSNLTVSRDLALTGNWEANFLVANPNKNLPLKLQGIRAYIYYHNKHTKISQRISLGQPVEVPARQERVIRISRMRVEQPDDVIVDEIHKRMNENSAVIFGLRLAMEASFRVIGTDLKFWCSSDCMRLRVELEGVWPPYAEAFIDGDGKKCLTSLVKKFWGGGEETSGGGT
ncbi:hypothetical protein CRG98_033476 [Punica granatum]|uniref:Uncharacterized protein n=1 Tax=Punica granatum TaxID=22663 RepID=A0A2I0IR09_PUNGR|nr:hypothetical protein CRG98_033476 [Punica granatum]